MSLETTNSLLDLLCFYGDGEPTPQKEQEEKEGLEDPEVWETCWSLFISYIVGVYQGDIKIFVLLALKMPWGGSDADIIPRK